MGRMLQRMRRRWARPMLARPGRIESFSSVAACVLRSQRTDPICTYTTNPSFESIVMRHSHRSIAIVSCLVLTACAVSQQQEVQMGQQEAQQVSAQLPILNDPQINNYVNALGQSIARTT